MSFLLIHFRPSRDPFPTVDCLKNSNILFKMDTSVEGLAPFAKMCVDQNKGVQKKIAALGGNGEMDDHPLFRHEEHTFILIFLPPTDDSSVILDCLGKSDLLFKLEDSFEELATFAKQCLIKQEIKEEIIDPDEGRNVAGPITPLFPFEGKQELDESMGMVDGFDGPPPGFPIEDPMNSGNSAKRGSFKGETEPQRRKSGRIPKPKKIFGEDIGFGEGLIGGDTDGRGKKRQKEGKVLMRMKGGQDESSDESWEDSSESEDEWREVVQPMDVHMNDSEGDLQGDAAEGVDEEQDDGEEVNETANDGDSQTPMDSKECPVDGCSMKFSSNEDLAEHMLRHQKPHKCRACKKPWQTPSALREHYRSHTGERPFECDLCQRKFSMSSHLKRHQRSHTDCSKISKDSQKECIVDGCSLTLPSINGLVLHMKSHTKPYHCRVCQKPWQQPRDLRKHYRSHTGEKPYTCTTCQKTFSQMSSLKDHIRSHTGERPFECDLCDQKFARPFTLKKHRRSHTGEKPYACTTCTYRCASSSDLIRHLRKHSEEKPFACTINGCDF